MIALSSWGIEYLEESITYCRQLESFNRFPIGDNRRAYYLTNLGAAVSLRFRQLGAIEDMEEVIACYRQALALRPHDHPDRSFSLCHLGLDMTHRFKQLGSYDDLLNAVKCFSESRNILPTGHPPQSLAVSNLAFIFLILSDTVSESDEKTKAFQLFEHAANHSPASAKYQFDAAVTWATAAHSRGHQSAVHAYTRSLTLLGRRLVLAPTIESQQSLLASVSKELAFEAASSSINRGEFRFAIELLDHGRVVLWSKLRGYHDRHPLDKLRNIDKELFDQFETLSGQLECLSMSVESRFKLSVSVESHVEELSWVIF